MPKNWGRGLSPSFQAMPERNHFFRGYLPFFFNYCCNRRLQSPSKNATFMFKTLKHVKKNCRCTASLAVFGRKVRIVCNHFFLEISIAFPFWSSPSLQLRLVSSLVSLLYLLLFISCFALQSASPPLPLLLLLLLLGAWSLLSCHQSGLCGPPHQPDERLLAFQKFSWYPYFSYFLF